MKNRRFGIVQICGFVCLILVCVALTPTSSKAAPKATSETFEMTLSNFLPPVTPQSHALDEWAQEIQNLTQGRLKINNIHGGTLLRAGKTYDGVTAGIADIGHDLFPYTPGRFMGSEAVGSVLGVTNAWIGTKMINSFYAKYRSEELADVKVLWMYMYQPPVLMANKPINKMEDIKGLKIRPDGALTSTILKGMGASPVAMPIPEVYDAMAKGVVEAVFTPADALKSFRLAEVVKYACKTPPAIGYAGCGYVVMNKDSWARLPHDIQAIITATGETYQSKFAEYWMVGDAKALEWAKGKGVKIMELQPAVVDRWKESAQRIATESYIKRAAEMGLPGEEYLNEATRLLEVWLKEWILFRSGDYTP